MITTHCQLSQANPPPLWSTRGGGAHWIPGEYCNKMFRKDHGAKPRGGRETPPLAVGLWPRLGLSAYGPSVGLHYTGHGVGLVRAALMGTAIYRTHTSPRSGCSQAGGGGLCSTDRPQLGRYSTVAADSTVSLSHTHDHTWTVARQP